MELEGNAASASSIVSKLSERCGVAWPTMFAAEKAALEERARRGKELSAAGLIPADTSLVVFGSLARGEWTQGSDLDWALLVDGPVKVQHATIAQRISDNVRVDGREPGPTGVF